MIKIGPLAKQAIAKQFPDNWKSLAIMMNIPFEMYNDGEDDLPEDMAIEIEFTENDILTIKADNSITTTSSIPPDLIGQIIVELAQKADQ